MNATMHAIFGIVMDELFKLEKKRHQAGIDQLVEENDALLGRRTVGFNYLGNDYGRQGWNMRGSPALHLDLVPKMSLLIQLQKTVQLEWQMMNHALRKLLEPCISFPDARDALPDCLVKLVVEHPEPTSLGVVLQDQMKMLARTRPVAWTLQNNPRDLHNFNKALVKIEAYCAMKYLY